MSKPAARSEVSVGYWMFALLITAIPIVNLVLVPILAFSGSDRTKKNYYRAILVWVLVIIALQILLVLAGFWPQMVDGARRLLGTDAG